MAVVTGGFGITGSPLVSLGYGLDGDEPPITPVRRTGRWVQPTVWPQRQEQHRRKRRRNDDDLLLLLT